MLPFYPPLVQPAIDTGAPVCPVAIEWTAEDPEVVIAEDIAYWRDEHTFGPHVWRLLGFRGVRAHIEFGRLIEPEGHTRKSLAADTQQAVGELLGIVTES